MPPGGLASIYVHPGRRDHFITRPLPSLTVPPTQSFESSYCWMRRLKWSSWVFSSPLWYLNLQRTDGLCVTWLVYHRVEFLVNSLRSSTYWSMVIRLLDCEISGEIVAHREKLLQYQFDFPRVMVRLWWKQIYNCSVLFEQKRPSSVSDNKGKYVDISRVSVLVLMSLRTY